MVGGSVRRESAASDARDVNDRREEVRDEGLEGCADERIKMEQILQVDELVGSILGKRKLYSRREGIKVSVKTPDNEKMQGKRTRLQSDRCRRK
jgi:hypothetical protein